MGGRFAVPGEFPHVAAAADDGETRRQLLVEE